MNSQNIGINRSEHHKEDTVCVVYEAGKGVKTPCDSCKVRVAKTVEKFFDSSLANGSAKQKGKFSLLTKLDKRAWREALQRAIAKIRSRVMARALCFKPRGKSARKVQQLSRFEETLIDNLRASETATYQAGSETLKKAAYVAGAAATLTMGVYTLDKVYRRVKKAYVDTDKVVSETAQDVKAVTGNLKKVTDDVSDMLKSFRTRFEEFVESIRRVGGWVFKLVIAAVGAWFANRYAGAPALVSLVSALVLMHVPEALTFVKDSGVVSQAGMGMTQLFALLCTLVVPNMKGSAGHIANNFMRVVTVFPRFSDGLEVFTDTIMKMCEQFVNWILKRDSSNWLTLGRKRDLIEVWRHQCIEVCSKIDLSAKPEREQIHELQRLIQDGYGFSQVMSHPETKREVSRWLDQLNKRLAPHLGTLAAENNMRVMPYCAILGGPSGAGKTSAVQVVAAMTLLLAGEVSADQVLQNLWQKGITEYWNGYLGQRAIIKDDCFQVRGVPGAQDSEAMEFIRAIGTWACPLNFADVESKGRYYLDVALIIGTTNAANIKSDWEPYITCPEALVRRFQGSYWIEVNPEYATPAGRYDFDKIESIYNDRLDAYYEAHKDDDEFIPTEDDVLDLFPWDAWTVRVHNFSNNSPSNAPIFPGGLKQAVKDAARTIRERRVAHERTVKNLNRHMKVAESFLKKVNFQAGEQWEGFSECDACSETTEVCEEFVPPYQDEIVPDDTHECGVLSTEEVTVYSPWVQPMALDREEEHESWFSRAKDSITTWVRRFYVDLGCGSGMADLMSNPLVTLGLIASATAVVGCAVKAMWALLKSVFGFFGVKTVTSQSTNPPAKKGGVSKHKFPQVQLQVGTPPKEGVHNAIYRNLYSISLEDDGVIDSVGNMLSLGETAFIMPAHFDDYIENKAKSTTRIWVMMCAEPTVRVSFDKRTWNKFRRAHFDSGTDLRGISFGRHIGLRANRNIVGYFLPQADITNVLRGTNSAVRLDVGRMDEKKHTVSKVTMMSTMSEYVDNVVANNRDVLRGLIKYNMPTMGGDCGAPLSLSENRYYGGKCILGLHVAGQTSLFQREGYAAITTQESIREAWLYLGHHALDGIQHEPEVANLVQEVPEAEFAQLQAGLTESGIIGGSISYLGPAVTPAVIATKSMIKRSPMHDDEVFGPCPTAPAILHPVVRGEEVVYPMAKAVEAYQSPLYAHDPAELDIAVEVAMTPHREVTKGFPRDILTFEEAITPPESWKLKPLNRRSSAGYKYREVIPNILKYPGKTYFLGFEGDVDFSRPELDVVRKDTQHIIEQARKGVRTTHICMDFLKDELRTLEKVEDVRTRMISGTELDYSIAVRQYFGAFQAAMYATAVKNGMSPGVNHYTEWHMLAEGLLSKGGSVFDGDFSRFDASEQPWVHEAILSYINRWYRDGDKWNPEDDIVRQVLWLDLTHSIHLTGETSHLGHLVQWHKSLPSGHPLTTVVNSMYSLITLTACYIHLTGDVVDMWKHAFINTYGDDNVVGVDEEVRDIFNQVTVAATMDKLFALKYTAGAKDGKLVPYTTIDKITFLQRGFLRDEDEEVGLITRKPNVGWVAPLNYKSFMYTPYFYRNNKDPQGDLASNCEKFVCELSLHPAEVWEEYFPRLDAWCSKNGIPLPVRNRDAARTYVKTRFDVWF